MPTCPWEVCSASVIDENHFGQLFISSVYKNTLFTGLLMLMLSSIIAT